MKNMMLKPKQFHDLNWRKVSKFNSVQYELFQEAPGAVQIDLIQGTELQSRTDRAYSGNRTPAPYR